jgi:hypothetical protein
MNPTHRVLAGLLAAQVGLVAFTWWPDASSQVEAHALIEAKKESVSAITITGKPSEGTTEPPVRLVREGARWVVASNEGFPADSTKIDEMVDKLLAIKVGSPLSTTAASLDALKVGDKEFGKKVDIEAGGQVTSLVIGAGSSSTIHVRRASDNDVYEGRGLSEWSISSTARSYWNTEYVQVPADSIGQFTLSRPDLTLKFVRVGDQWTVEGLPEGAAADSTKIDAFIQKFTSVRVAEIAGKGDKPEFGVQAGLRIAFAGADGKPLHPPAITLGTVVDSRIHVQAEGDPFVILANKAGLEEALTASLEAFLAPSLVETAAPPAP